MHVVMSKTQGSRSLDIRTPVGTSHDGIVTDTRRCTTCNAKVSEFDASVLVCKDISTLDVSVNDTLIVQVYQSFQDLRNIDRYEVFWKLSKAFADVVEGAVFTESNRHQRRFHAKGYEY